MTQIVVKAEDYGLKNEQESSKAAEISKMFKPMLDTMVEYEKEYNILVKKEINAEVIQEATMLLKKYVKVRTGTDAIHKEIKAFYLKGGRFVDGWKNAQIMASSDIEKSLKGIKEHYINIEKQEIARLKEEREAILLKYKVEALPENIGHLTPEVWENYLNGVKLGYDAKIKADQEEVERKSEEQRVKRLHQSRKEKLIGWWQFLAEEQRYMNYGEMSDDDYHKMLADAKTKKQEKEDEDERIRLQNVQLQKEAEERERLAKIEEERKMVRTEELRPYIIFIRDYSKMISMDDAEYKKEFSDIKKGAEDHWEFERKEIIRKQKEADDKVIEDARIQKLWRDRLEELPECTWNGQEAIDPETDEILITYDDIISISNEKFDKVKKAWSVIYQARIVSKQKEDDLKAKEQQAEDDLKKGDAEKVKDLIKDLETIIEKYEFKSIKNKEMFHAVKGSIRDTIDVIKNA